MDGDDGNAALHRYEARACLEALQGAADGQPSLRVDEYRPIVVQDSAQVLQAGADVVLSGEGEPVPNERIDNGPDGIPHRLRGGSQGQAAAQLEWHCLDYQAVVQEQAVVGYEKDRERKVCQVLKALHTRAIGEPEGREHQEPLD